MDSINADTTIVNIMGFMDPGSASQFRRCERRMRSIMDSAKYWEKPPKITREGCEDPPEPYQESGGLHKIVISASFKEWKCVSCASVSSTHVHPFYRTVVCRKCCAQKLLYRVTGEKAACKKYFVAPSDLEGIPKIQKSRGVFRVLEHHVKTRAENKHGKDVVTSKLAKRSKRAETIHHNRSSSYIRRRHLLTMYTKSSLRRSSVRVDSHLMDTSVLIKLAGYHRLYSFIIRDVLDFKVTSNFSVENAKDKLFDFACFLSHCRRTGVLMDDYKTPCPHHDDFNPTIVFVDHCEGGAHFYEYMTRYVGSIESLIDRSRNVVAYTACMGEAISRENRRDICSIVCAEDGVCMDTDSFDDSFDEYIGYGVGDPVMIARECRKMSFLRSRGYDEDFDYFLNVHRMCICRSSENAKRTTLIRCRGYPIMNRVFTDDGISGFSC